MTVQPEVSRPAGRGDATIVAWPGARVAPPRRRCDVALTPGRSATATESSAPVLLRAGVRTVPAQPTGPTLAVTVLIPAFDREEYVADAVRSAFAQRPYPPAEVLVVDDASRDDTAEQARRAGARVLRLDVNRGRGGARNAGFAAATHSWVALLDSDDTWEPDHLSRLWPHRQGRVLVSASALSSRRARVFGNPGRRPLEITCPSQLFWPENPVVTSSVLVDRQALTTIGGFSERTLAQDLETWIRLLETGSALVLPEIHVVYREHSGQASADRLAVHAAVRAILAANERHTWHDRGLVKRLLSLQDAELLARAWRQRRWREVATVGGRLTRRPASAASLVRAALWHHRARRAAGRTAPAAQ